MVITEPAEPSAQLLGLGSKQYSSNMQGMFNEDFTRSVMQIIFKSAKSSMQVKERLCWYGGTFHGNAERAYFLLYCEHGNRKQAKTCYFFIHKSVSN